MSPDSAIESVPPVAIRVEGLGKRYRIGVQDDAHDTIMAAAGAWIRSPLDNFRRIRRLADFDGEDGDDVVWALRDVSFEVALGEVVGIVGHNGAGKSTLLKILSRITDPTEGFAEIRGRVSSLLEVGTGFHPEMTGRENVFLNGAILGMTRAEIGRKFEEIVEFAGVARFIDTPVKKYSSGMRVRLAFSVAAHLEPEILLVDEVLSVGDAGFQEKCLDKMREVTRHGRTVLFVSHNLPSIRSLCPRAILLDGGSVTMDGDSGRVVEEYVLGSVRGSGGEIPADAHRAGTGEVQVRRVRVLDRDDVETDRIFLGDPFTVVLDLAAASRVEDIVIRVSLSDLDGTPITSSISSMDLGRGIPMDHGTHRVRLRLDVPLLPRRYSLGIAIVDTAGRDIDLIDRTADLTALPVSRDGDRGYPWSNVVGYVCPPGRWEVSST